MTKGWKLLCGVLLLAQVAWAGDEWEVVATGRVTVKTRERPGSEVKEIWAEGPIDAPVKYVEEAILDAERFPSFMPYVREARFLKATAPDGSRLVYTRLDLPMITSRDYVLKVMVDEKVAEDGSGQFRQRWHAVNDLLPHRANVIRLTLNEGSWHVTAKGDGKSWAVMTTNVDPAGWVPAFAADMANKRAVPDTFIAVEKEAQRRFAERKPEAPPPDAVAEDQKRDKGL